MSNLVLYRKYRPKEFGEIIGQEHVVQTLTNALLGNVVSHAYLFSGPRGSGKTTIARLLAKAVNCENRGNQSFWLQVKGLEEAKKENPGVRGVAFNLPDGWKYEPCNKCYSCLEINDNKAIDLIEIDAASNRGIDEMRELREGIRFSPTKLKYKVFIIDEAHQLTKEAANALLKTLEEPPAHSIFILATTEIHKMIPTIISRCQRFDFRKLTLPEIIKRLEIVSKKEKVKIEKSALELIALNSGGSIRDAEGLLDQALAFSGAKGNAAELKAEDIKGILGIVDVAIIGQFVDFVSEKKTASALEFLNQTLESGYDPQEFAKTLIRYLREALIFKIVPDLTNPMTIGLTKEEKEKLRAQTAIFQEEDLRRALRLFLDAENKMRYSPISQLPLELAIIEALQKEEK